MNRQGMLRWKAMFGWTAGLTGLLGAAPSPAAAATVLAQGDYLPATAAPAAWQAFSKQLQTRFQEQLAADDVVQQVQEALAERARAAGGSADALAVRAWILPGGQIERVEFSQIAPILAVRLRALLSRVDVGAPPPDMLQPVHVRLSFRPKDQPKNQPREEP